ncbi:MAG: hypothetical protein ABSG25_08615, partial [Bryobacteraceae bacterium]
AVAVLDGERRFQEIDCERSCRRVVYEGRESLTFNGVPGNLADSPTHMSAEAQLGKGQAPQGLIRLLMVLHPNRDSAWQEYDRLRRKLVTFFEHNHCHEPEELAEEALDRIGRKPDLHEIRNVAEYAFGVARILRMESSRKASIKISIEELPAGKSLRAGGESPEFTTIERIETERKLRFLTDCLKRLSTRDRQLILQYYSPEIDNIECHRLRLAELHGVTIGALRTRMTRCRQRLEECFQTRCSVPQAATNQCRDIPGVK